MDSLKQFEGHLLLPQLILSKLLVSKSMGAAYELHAVNDLNVVSENELLLGACTLVLNEQLAGQKHCASSARLQLGCALYLHMSNGAI